MDRRRFLARTAQAAAGLGMLGRVTACRPSGSDPAFAALREHYFRTFLERNPVTATYLGADGYDPAFRIVNGKLRDYSADGRTAELDFCRSILRTLEETDTDRLTPADRIDHAVIQAQASYVVHMLSEVRYHERSIESYVAEPFRGVDWQLQGMTDLGSGQIGTEQEWAHVVERVTAIPAYLDVARANLEAGRGNGNLPDRRQVDRDGIRGAVANAEYFRATLPGTARGYLGPRLFGRAVAAQLDAGGARAAEAWERFGGFLRTAYDPAETTDRFAAGETEYAWRLAHCLMEARSPAELWDYGAAQVALYEDRIIGTAEEVARAAGLPLAFDTPEARRAGVRAAMDHLAGESPRDDAELFRWYRDAGTRAVAYGRAQALFDIPTAYMLDIVETPPVLRSSTDASYYPAPPFKRSGVGRFYLTPTGNDPAALRLNNRASIATTAVHEGFPGHDWHYKYMTSRANEISPVRWLTPGAVEDGFSMWEDSMASEGWALYAEELMAEPGEGRPHGFYTPSEHVYELQAQLLRAVRVRVDVGIHTGRMTFDEAVDYFAEHVEFAPGARGRMARDPQARAIIEGATRAIYRYSKWPTQAITYNLGKNAIIELREAVRQKQGAAFSPQRFHERFMAMGTIPAGYIRDEFLAAS